MLATPMQGWIRAILLNPLQTQHLPREVQQQGPLQKPSLYSPTEVSLFAYANLFIILQLEEPLKQLATYLKANTKVFHKITPTQKN